MSVTLRYMLSVRQSFYVFNAYLLLITINIISSVADDINPFSIATVMTLLYLTNILIAPFRDNEFLHNIPTLFERVRKITLLFFSLNMVLLLLLGAASSFGILFTLIIWVCVDRLKLKYPKYSDKLDIVKFFPILFSSFFGEEISSVSASLTANIVFALFTIDFIALQYKEMTEVTVPKKINRTNTYIPHFPQFPHFIGIKRPAQFFKRVGISVALIAAGFLVHFTDRLYFGATICVVVSYFACMFLGAGYGDLRAIEGWYALRPGKGTLYEIQMKKFFIFSVCVLGIYLTFIALFILSLLVKNSFNVDVIMNFVKLCVSSYLLSIGVMSFFATNKTEGLRSLLTLLFIGVPLGILLLISGYSLGDTGTTANWLVVFCLIIGVLTISFAFIRVRKINWI